MSCEERERLEREHIEAGAAFNTAREALRNRTGISPKEEFVTLRAVVNQAWETLMHARAALERHITEHGCEAGAVAKEG
jgi:hypothetical protein